MLKIISLFLCADLRGYLEQVACVCQCVHVCLSTTLSV